MGRPLYTNNAATYLAFGITNTATTMQVSANAGSLFPNPTGGDYFYVSLISLSGPIIEIVKCTARSGDIFTIERGQEGTSPLYWNMGDNVQLRITAAGMNYIAGAAVQSTEEQVFTATQGQTVFTLTNFDYAPGTNNLAVFVNGSKQVYGVNYSETSVNTVTFNSGLNAGDVVEFLVGISVASGTLYANEINYNEGGVNAVTNTVQSKLQQTISVEDFGAIGNGVHDDTAAIQAAINAANPYDTIEFNGQYLISSTIQVTKPIKLKGNRYGSSLWGSTVSNGGYVKTSGTSITAFNLVGGNWAQNVISSPVYVLDVIFEDMTILGYDGGFPYTGTGINLDTSVQTNARNVKFIRTNIHFFNVGINLTGCAYLTEFQDSVITTCNTGLIFALGSNTSEIPSQNRFYNMTFDNIQGYCVNLTNAGYGDFRFYGCTISESGNGVYCRFDQDITFDGCTFESLGGSPGTGIRITANNPTVTNNNNSKVIIGNKFITSNYCIYFDTTDGTQDNYQCPVVIIGNDFYGNIFLDTNATSAVYSKWAKSFTSYNNYFVSGSYVGNAIAPKVVTDLFYGTSTALTQQYDPYRISIDVPNPSSSTTVYRHMVENGEVVTISYIEFASLNPSTYAQGNAQMTIYGGSFSNTIYSQTGSGVYVELEKSVGNPVTWKNTSGSNQYIIVQVNNAGTGNAVVGTVVFTVTQQ